MTPPERAVAASTIYSQRSHAWLPRGFPLICPRGHKMKTNALLLEQGVVSCQWWVVEEQRRCGELVYVLVCPERIFLTPVTAAEMRAIESLYYDVDRVLAFLGNPTPLALRDSAS